MSWQCWKDPPDISGGVQQCPWARFWGGYIQSSLQQDLQQRLRLLRGQDGVLQLRQLRRQGLLEIQGVAWLLFVRTYVLVCRQAALSAVASCVTFCISPKKIHRQACMFCCIAAFSFSKYLYLYIDIDINICIYISICIYVCIYVYIL